LGNYEGVLKLFSEIKELHLKSENSPVNVIHFSLFILNKIQQNNIKIIYLIKKIPSSVVDPKTQLNSDVYRILLETFLANTNSTDDQESLSLLLPKKTSTLNFSQSKSFNVERKIKMQRQNELFRSFLIFQEMKSNGIEADSAIYNTLINACAEAGDLEKVIFVFEINSLFYFKIFQ
jgi:hypothetical protein